MRILIAGEGATEIGDRALEPAYRDRPPVSARVGLIEAFLSRVKAAGSWTIADGVLWKTVRKYRSGEHRSAETRTVLGLALLAEEHRCDALVFVRDRDRDERRRNHIDEGVRHAAQLFPAVHVVGGVAVEEIEAWVLALLSQRDSERHANPKEILGEQASVEEMERIVANANLAAIPDDARSLLGWIRDLAAL